MDVMIALKGLIGIDKSDTSLDDKLKFIIDSVTYRLKLRLGGMEPPNEMGHIITEVSVIRFNRFGSEGVKTQSVEGESNQYNENDFSGFKDEIQAFLDSQEETKKGRVVFL